jgi:hypothetical protein
MATHLQVVVFCLATGVCVIAAAAAPFQNGQVSELRNDVRFTGPENQTSKLTTPIAIQDGSLETGAESRAQITFADQAVVRMGDNTQVAINSKSRKLELTSGAIFTQVPAGLGRTTIKVRGIVATATGTTLVIECLPQAYTKFISLEGTSRLCLGRAVWSQDCVLIRAGQMLIAGPDAKSLPEAVDVDLTHLLETCQFITEFPELTAKNRLVKAATVQRNRKSHGKFAETNLVIFGRGTVVSKRNSGTPNEENGSSPSSASPSPSPVPH